MLDEFWSRKLEEALEISRNRKIKPDPIDILPPLPKLGPKKPADFQIKQVRGHYEVWRNGKFYCTADTRKEAEMECS